MVIERNAKPPFLFGVAARIKWKGRKRLLVGLIPINLAVRLVVFGAKQSLRIWKWVKHG